MCLLLLTDNWEDFKTIQKQNVNFRFHMNLFRKKIPLNKFLIPPLNSHYDTFVGELQSSEVDGTGMVLQTQTPKTIPLA